MKKAEFKKLNFPPHKYFHMATVFADDGKVLYERHPDSASLPTYYLYCHSIELGLKGFLRLKGVHSKELRKKRQHNLDALYAECVTNDLVIPGRDPEADRKLIAKLNAYYQDKQFEYMELGGWLLPCMSAVSEYTHALLGACAKYRRPTDAPETEGS